MRYVSVCCCIQNTILGIYYIFLLYLSTYVYTYIYIYTHNIHIYVYYVYTYICIYIYSCMCVCVCVCARDIEKKRNSMMSMSWGYSHRSIGYDNLSPSGRTLKIGHGHAILSTFLWISGGVRVNDVRQVQCHGLSRANEAIPQ